MSRSSDYSRFNENTVRALRKLHAIGITTTELDCLITPDFVQVLDVMDKQKIGFYKVAEIAEELTQAPNTHAIDELADKLEAYVNGKVCKCCHQLIED